MINISNMTLLLPYSHITKDMRVTLYTKDMRVTLYIKFTKYVHLETFIS